MLFDPKKTHLQVVQRCDEVLKLLLGEEMLTDDLLARFWSLTRSDLKTEVFKIISDCAFYFKQHHLTFIFNKIKNDTPIEKLGMEEFTCLSELGKYSKDLEGEFQGQVAQFFWGLVVSPDTKNAELLSNCIQKYRDMVRYWDLGRKQQMMDRLQQCIRDPSTPTLPCLRLLRGLIQDQADRIPSGTSAAANKQGTAGSSLRFKMPDAQPQGEPLANEQTEPEVEVTHELTLQSVLRTLVTGETNLITDLLSNLARYSEAAN